MIPYRALQLAKNGLYRVTGEAVNGIGAVDGRAVVVPAHLVDVAVLRDQPGDVGDIRRGRETQAAADVAFSDELAGADLEVHAVQHVIERASRFSLFFLPLFTVSRTYANVCSNCGGVTPLTREQATHGLEWAERNRQVG